MRVVSLSVLIAFGTFLSARAPTGAALRTDPLSDAERARIEALVATTESELSDDERLELALLVARDAQDRARVADTKANTLIVFTVIGVVASVALGIVALAPDSEGP